MPKNGDLAYGQTSAGVDVPLLADTSNRLVGAPASNYDSDFVKADVFTKAQSITLSADGAVKATPGCFLGILCTASTSGEFKLLDGGSGGTIKVGDASNFVSMSAGDFIRLGFALEFATDIYLDINGTLTVNVFYT